MRFNFDFKAPAHHGSSPSAVSSNRDVEAIQYVNMATAFLQKHNGSSLNQDSADHKDDDQHHLSNLATSRLPFPLKLYQMLEDTECQGKCHIISWLPGGNGLVIHKPQALTDELLPHYFRQTKYRSFTRQVCTLKCMSYRVCPLTCTLMMGCFAYVDCIASYVWF